MALKQCVACNNRVPGSKKTCVCGHVFTQAKMIGGKRYSGYRAMWYSRSDPRRGSAKKSNGRLMIHAEKKLNKRLGNNPRPKRRLSKETTTNDDLASKTQQLQKPKPGDLNMTYLKSPQLIEKLNDALDDINKRIARQSLLWTVLKSSKY